MNSRAAGSPRAYEEAAKVVREDADRGEVLQQFVIALLSREPDAPVAARLSDGKRKKFLSESRNQIRAMAEDHGNPLAFYLLSMESDDRSLLERAAAGGNVQALNAHGTMLLNEAEGNPLLSTNELAKIRGECYRNFKWASDQGDINGFYNLGMCLMNGYGCKPDPKMAFDCFMTAAKAGHAEAINCIGGCFRDGVVVRRDVKLSVLWFQKSAELENEFGIYNYANALLTGEGVKKDPERAVEMLAKLVKGRPNAEAMNLLGVCRLRGVGCEKDEAGAFSWFCKSAEKGMPVAMHHLADCYDRGIGTEKNDQLSLLWRMRARAASGDRAAAEWLKASREP